MDNLADLFGKITWGSVPTWLQVGILLTILWKGVPAFLDAISNRQSKIEERMQDLLDKATIRFERELKAADKRHEDCMAANEQLAQRVTASEERMAKQARTIADQGDALMCAQQTIDGLKRQIVQMQVSTINALPGAAAGGVMEHMMQQLDQIPGTKR